jgi:catechol 2,3-dioxygenase-like lactoylglutathione lyase family enzyme
MSKLPDAQLSHIGLRVGDLPKMIAFYERTLGLVLTDRGALSGRELAFLSRNNGNVQTLIDALRQQAKGG